MGLIRVQSAVDRAMMTRPYPWPAGLGGNYRDLWACVSGHVLTPISFGLEISCKANPVWVSPSAALFLATLSLAPVERYL